MNSPHNPEGSVIETAERIVIDYANFSGRESAHRAEFREAVIKNLRSLLLSQQEQLAQVAEEKEKAEYERGRVEQYELMKADMTSYIEQKIQAIEKKCETQEMLDSEAGFIGGLNYILKELSASAIRKFNQ